MYLWFLINKFMTNLTTFLKIVESKSKEKLHLESLPYKRNQLAPVMSQATVDYHYGELAKGYVDRYNKGEGDPVFNEAGAFLHNIFFPQLMPPKLGNKPKGASLSLIERKFDSFDKFKEEMKKEAMKIQGSGWIYLSRSGDIKTIKNHQIRRDIALLIDWWEHAWAKDYASNKARYFDNIWRCINWDRVNIRIYAGK
jgi:Fe-Mn family superoxide dismutase